MLEFAKSTSRPMAAWLILQILAKYNSMYTEKSFNNCIMATHGLHWKWQSLTPCQRHPSEPIEKIFGTIDYVIDLNNLANLGFGKIFPDGGTHTQHIRVHPFFLLFIYLFFELFTLFDEGAALNWSGWKKSAELILTPFGESQTLF